MGTTRYTVLLGDEKLTFEGPDNLSDKDIADLGDKYLKTAKPGQVFQHSTVQHVGPPAVGEGESSAVGSFVRGLPSDALFNFDDELAAVGNAAGLAPVDNAVGMTDKPQQAFWNNPDGFWAAVKANMGSQKEQLKADETLHPTASALGRITGVLATIPIALRAAAGRIPAAASEFMEAHPVLTGTALSGAGGTVSGAGAGEQGTRGQSAAIGGLTGAALGHALSLGFEFAPAVARYAKIFLNKATDTEAYGQILKALKRDGFPVDTPEGAAALKQELAQYGDKPVSLADVGSSTRTRAGVALRAPSKVQQQSIDRVMSRQEGQGQRLAADVRANVAPRTDVHALNDDLVAQRAKEAETLRDRALFEDGGAFINKSFDDMEGGKVHDFEYTTPKGEKVPGQLLVDKDGNGVLELMGSDRGLEGANRAGPASMRQALGVLKTQFPELKTLRAEGRLTGARAASRGGVQNPTVDMSTIEERAAGRQSRIVNDPQLQQLARLPMAQKALKEGLSLAEAERGRLAVTGQPIDHLPDLHPGADLDVRTFDTMKRFLDQQVSALYKGDTPTFKAAELNEVKALRDAIRDRLKEVVPEYGDYLGAYKGSSEMIDALDAGQEFNKLPPEQIAKGQGERSEAAQELYKVGAARNLLDVIRGTGDTRAPASRILNSDEARSQLEATGIDPTNLAALNKAVHQERTLGFLPRELQGSDTARRQIAQADADAGVHIPVPFNIASKPGWIGAAWRGMTNHISVNRNAAVNELLLPRLLETDPAAVNAVIDELEKQGQFTAAQALKRKARERASAVTTGAVIGAPTALETDDGR